MNKTNVIHETAIIHHNVHFGEYNVVGKNVVIDIVGKNSDKITVNIGDNNIINDNTRIIISGKLSIGDWNVFHNNMLIMAELHIIIGHNCWFGQNTILDGTGGLIIGNGVRVGMYSQIWTHVGSGERLEGCTLYSNNETIIEDDVWLVGSCIVGSGIYLSKQSIVLINSVVTKNTLPQKTYSGTPAKLMESLEFYKPLKLQTKFEMMKEWLIEFCELNHNVYDLFDDKIIIRDVENNETVTFTTEPVEIQKGSTFSLLSKKYNKTNSGLERKIYKYLYNNKARFLPL